MTYNGGPYYPVFKFHGASGIQVYRYMGDINFDQILKDKAYDDPAYKNNAPNYTTPVWATPSAKADKALIKLLKIERTPNIGGYKFNSIYLCGSNYDRIGSYKDNPQPWNCRLLYVFAKDSAGDFQPVNAGSKDFKFKNLFMDAFEDVDFTKIKTSTAREMTKISFGEAYIIEPSWVDTYFKSSGGVDVGKYSTSVDYINDNLYKTAGVNLTA
jgi:hypothetical protein